MFQFFVFWIFEHLNWRIGLNVQVKKNRLLKKEDHLSLDFEPCSCDGWLSQTCLMGPSMNTNYLQLALPRIIPVQSRWEHPHPLLYMPVCVFTVRTGFTCCKEYLSFSNMQKSVNVKQGFHKKMSKLWNPYRRQLNYIIFVLFDKDMKHVYSVLYHKTLGGRIILLQYHFYIVWWFIPIQIACKKILNEVIIKQVIAFFSNSECISESDTFQVQ